MVAEDCGVGDGALDEEFGELEDGLCMVSAVSPVEVEQGVLRSAHQAPSPR